MKQGSRYLVRESVLVRHFRKETFLDSQKKSFDLLQPVFDMLRNAGQFSLENLDIEVLADTCEERVRFLGLYRRAVTTPAFRSLMRLCHRPWLPLLKYEALVMTCAHFLKYTFKNRSSIEIHATRHGRASDLQGGLAAVWRGTATRANAALVKVSKISSASARWRPVTTNLRIWFRERDLSRYLGEPSSYDGDGSHEILSEGVWVRFPYHHPEAACIQGEAQGYKPGFLGICWYSLGNTMRMNVLLASDERELGHEFSTSGVF